MLRRRGHRARQRTTGRAAASRPPLNDHLACCLRRSQQPQRLARKSDLMRASRHVVDKFVTATSRWLALFLRMLLPAVLFALSVFGAVPSTARAQTFDPATKLAPDLLSALNAPNTTQGQAAQGRSQRTLCESGDHGHLMIADLPSPGLHLAGCEKSPPCAEQRIADKAPAMTRPAAPELSAIKGGVFYETS